MKKISLLILFVILLFGCADGVDNTEILVNLEAKAVSMNTSYDFNDEFLVSLDVSNDGADEICFGSYSWAMTNETTRSWPAIPAEILPSTDCRYKIEPGESFNLEHSFQLKKADMSSSKNYVADTFAALIKVDQNLYVEEGINKLVVNFNTTGKDSFNLVDSFEILVENAE